MNRFFLITNTFKDPGLILTEKICQYIQNAGGTCTYVPGNDNMKDGRTVLDQNLIPKDTQCILVIGGDGTLIKAAGDMLGLAIPMVGINLGNLGYLCELEEKTVYQAIDQIMADHYFIEQRMMLKGYVSGNGKQTEETAALNDIVIHRSGALHVINYHVYVNDEYLSSYKADGIIVATPTGSTAYNMSAGGPIVDPKANMLLLTPINSHMLNDRSIVLSPEDTVSIEVGSRGQGNDNRAEVSFDGNNAVPVMEGDRLVITRAEENTRILKLSNISFLEILRKKMQTYR